MRAVFLAHLIFAAATVAGHCGIPVEVTEGINRLWSEMKPKGKSAVSPAAAFYTLVMLGEMDGGETAGKIGEITKIGTWKNKAGGGDPTTGWMRLGNTWWVDESMDIAGAARDVGRRFRTEFVPVDFWDPDIAGNPPDREGFAGVRGGAKGVLMTDAEYKPQWQFAFRGGGSGKFFCGGGKSIMVRYIQSFVVPVRHREFGGGGWEFSVPLKGGGKAAFCVGGGPGGNPGEWGDKEAIVFLPRAKLSETIDASTCFPLDRTVGAAAAYGRLFSAGVGRVDRWTVKSTVEFSENGGEDWRGGAGRAPQPIVLRVDRPFSYAITGAGGEIVMAGDVACLEGVGETE